MQNRSNEQREKEDVQTVIEDKIKVLCSFFFCFISVTSTKAVVFLTYLVILLSNYFYSGIITPHYHFQAEGCLKMLVSLLDCGDLRKC